MVAHRLAFITGAGSGIGREACRILAGQGAKVIAGDWNLKSAKETISALNDSKHTALSIDVSNSESVTKAFKEIKERYSVPATVIVNCAGITRDEFLLKQSQAEFEEVINVNLKGTFFINKIAAQEIMDAKFDNGGSIINVGSIVGKTGNMGQANYTASKAGVEALTKTASQEFGQFGIRVNTVIPGFIVTAMTETVPNKIRAMLIKRIPLQRMGKPEEVAQVIAFLASNRSSYINGASIEVTGGLH